MEIREGLTFDDVLLVPQYSEVKSRSQVDVTAKLKGLEFAHPIIPANMKTVTGSEMVAAVIESGGLAILHRFMPFQAQWDIAEDVIKDGHGAHFALSVGVKPVDKDNLIRFKNENINLKIVCIDIAHGDSNQCIEMTHWIRENFPQMCIIAGNVATGLGAERLWRAGADVVKVGVGPGSLCTTRIETGNGVPQLTALMDVSERRAKLTQPSYNIKYKGPDDAYGERIDDPPIINRPINIIADGGIKSAGDIVKALCFADMVMVGNLFAGCVEAPGKTHCINGVCYKEYVGSSTHKSSHVEGVEAQVLCKGPYNQVLTKLLEGLRSGCSYQGVNSLTELRENPAFIRISSAGLRESHPHDVIAK